MRDLGRVLITGAQGVLGAALVNRLRGHPVTATDLATPDQACDLTNFAQALAVVQGGYDTIFHCGAVSGPTVMANQPLKIWRIIALGTAHVLEAARRTGRARLFICSTFEVYGPLTRAVDELSPPHPMSIYAASKVAAEQATH
ncbi:MAG: NAD(P)-dependent oxidoreductase [Candidatus Saccharibacteria bacterium]|nr:NAD(P)-dependent oxidoreductase [Pseudorhodobacter sp.]